MILEFSGLIFIQKAELSLQPSQAYFIAETDEEMKIGLGRQLLPLIRISC